MSSDRSLQTFFILVIEDNAADVHLLELALKKAGLNFKLVVLEDGAEAMAFIRREDKYAKIPIPDLAILDLNLPRTSGMEVLAALRRSALASVPVAIVTSSSAPQERMKAQALHVERFITKPPDLEDFLQMGTTLKEVLLGSQDSLGSAPE